MHRTDPETRTNRVVPGSDETHRNATDPWNPDTFNLKHKTTITNAHKLSSDPTADGPPDADHHRAVPGDGRKIAASASQAAPTSPVPIQPAIIAKTASAPRRPLMHKHKRPRRIGDVHCRDRRAPARRDITPSQSRRHHAAADTPRTTACLTALSRRPLLLILPAAPPRQRDAARSARATTDSTLTHRSDGARGHDPRPSVPPRASTASRGRHRPPVTHRVRHPCQSTPHCTAHLAPGRHRGSVALAAPPAAATACPSDTASRHAQLDHAARRRPRRAPRSACWD